MGAPYKSDFPPYKSDFSHTKVLQGSKLLFQVQRWIVLSFVPYKRELPDPRPSGAFERSIALAATRAGALDMVKGKQMTLFQLPKAPVVTCMSKSFKLVSSTRAGSRSRRSAGGGGGSYST